MLMTVAVFTAGICVGVLVMASLQQVGLEESVSEDQLRAALNREHRDRLG